MCNTVKCPICGKEVDVGEGQTRTEALLKHLLSERCVKEENNERTD